LRKDLDAFFKATERWHLSERRALLGVSSEERWLRYLHDAAPQLSLQEMVRVRAVIQIDEALAMCASDSREVGILQFLKIGADAYEFTACWATVLARGATHKMHQHPNNFLSGVYYVRTYPRADSINFHHPRNQSGIIRPPVVELTAENSDQVVVRVKNGTMLVFPAYMQHSVDASGSEKERISISFNIMFSSLTQNLSKPLVSGGAHTRWRTSGNDRPRRLFAYICRNPTCSASVMTAKALIESGAV
jgi:hypothetical protein